MSTFVDNVTSLLKEQKITKNKMLSDLNLSRNSFIDWKKRGTIPSASVVSAIAEYLGTTISSLIGYPEEEEMLNTFPSKLTFQLDVTGKKISELANYLDISDEIVMNWIKGSDNTYVNYYEQLSDFFEILPRYWTSPGMLSPGIEPNIDEYLLILLYRDYKNTGIYDPKAYGDLEHYFPGLRVTTNFSVLYSAEDNEWLSLIHRLPEKKRVEFKERIEGYLECYEESVAADEALKKTGTENMGK